MQIEHNQKFITNTFEAKFLGLIIDDTLNWTQHTDHLCKKWPQHVMPLVL